MIRRLPILFLTGLFLCGLCCAGLSCKSSSVSPVRFANKPPIWHVNDKKHVATAPPKSPFAEAQYFYDSFVHKRITYGLSFPGKPRAKNTNALDEVPNSTWFTNRIGRFAMTPEQVAAGPNTIGSPMDHKPWTILGSKIGGVSIGFIVQDTRGVRFLLKFDLAREPETETATDAIVQRLYWAFGFNTPEDYIVSFHPKELFLDSEATITNDFGEKIPMTQEFVDQQLAQVSVDTQGNIRSLVSMFLQGKLLGGHERRGLRKGDPNDTIPHELLRELRGAYPLFAWLDHVDIKEGNTLDVYQSDPQNPDHKYVVHYFIDFGKALGALGKISAQRRSGYVYGIDFPYIFGSLVSLGLWRKNWEKRPVPEYKGVGLYGSESYLPGKWKSSAPAYFPIMRTDSTDGFWGAKILMRFTKEHLEAVVSKGELSNVDARKYLVKTLIARQRKTAQYWFDKVSPLDDFQVKKGQICMKDLALVYDLLPKGKDTSYTAENFDYEGTLLGKKNNSLLPNTSGNIPGQVCITRFAKPTSHNDYQILKIAIKRNKSKKPAVFVHTSRDPLTNKVRIVGIWRER